MVNITARQEIAARELLGWSRSALARAANVSVVTIARFEAGARSVNAATLSAIRVRLEAQGIEFAQGEQPAVALKVAGSSIPAEDLNASNDE